MITRSAEWWRAIGFDVATEVDARPRPLVAAEVDRVEHPGQRAKGLTARVERDNRAVRGREGPPGHVPAGLGEAGRVRAAPPGTDRVRPSRSGPFDDRLAPTAAR